MNEITAKNVFVVNEWFRTQVGKKFEKLPDTIQLKDGRYRAEIQIPTTEMTIVVAGKTRVEAINRLFANSVDAIEQYCKNNFLKLPEVLITDQFLLEEVGDKVDIVLNPKYKKKPEIKCPICGGIHFIQTEPPLYYSPDAHAKSENIYGCVNCGYIVMFNKSVPTIYQETLKEIENINNQIIELNERYKASHSDEKILEQNKKDLKRYETELTQRQEWGEDNKTTRSLLESIECEKNFIKTGCAHQNERDFKELQHSINLLEDKKKVLEKKIESFSI